MELFTVSVCPVCNTEGMNQIWQQGETAYVSICETCDTLSLLTIGKGSMPPIPIEALAEDFAVTFVHLSFGVVDWIRRFVINLWKSFTNRKPSTKL